MVVDVNNRHLRFTKGMGIGGVTEGNDAAPEIYTVTGQRVERVGDKGIYLLRYPERTVKVIR